MADPLKIHDYLRAQTVERWTIINKTRRQSVAEHSWMVTVIAMRLYQEVSVDNRNMLPLIVAALFHDAPESRTGDIPTPGKEHIRGRSHEGIFEDIDADLMPVLPYVGGKVEPIDRMILKMADAIEAAAWIHENGVGEHARVVAHKMYERLTVRVEESSTETGRNWFGAVNEVLMALGAPIIHNDSWIHKL